MIRLNLVDLLVTTVVELWVMILVEKRFGCSTKAFINQTGYDFDSMGLSHFFSFTRLYESMEGNNFLDQFCWDLYLLIKFRQNVM